MTSLWKIPAEPRVGAPDDVESRATPFSTTVYLVAGTLVAAVVVSHWPTLSRMAERWSTNPQYSHGYIVPVFALVVLWSRRGMLKRVTWKPAWIGLPLLWTGVMVRLLAIQTDVEPLDAFALLPTVFGAVLLVGGWSILNWTWPALAFLTFMIPLPFSLDVALAVPLRRIATVMSTFALQTLGCPAVAEGNTIVIDEMRPLFVEEACSGLGMLMTFFALATALAMIVSSPWWDRLALIVCAVPIAILTNVLRITITGLLYFYAGRDSELAQLIYHDGAGILMMPIAMGLLWGVLRLLSYLFVEVPDAAPLPITKPMPRTFTREASGEVGS